MKMHEIERPHNLNLPNPRIRMMNCKWAQNNYLGSTWYARYVLKKLIVKRLIPIGMPRLLKQMLLQE